MININGLSYETLLTKIERVLLTRGMAKERNLMFSSNDKLRLVDLERSDGALLVSKEDLGFDYSPEKKYLEYESPNSKKGKLRVDIRDAIILLSNSDVDKSDFSIDLYSITTMAINVGMMKGRGEYTRPSQEKRERDKRLREDAPSDDQLAQDWGYDDWDDFSSTI